MKKLILILILIAGFYSLGQGKAYAASAKINNVTNKTLGFNKLNSIEHNLLKAGPAEAASLTNISGQLFAYLAVISLMVWIIQNLLFGDKGIKEFMLFAFLIMFVRGMLAGYNLFFVGTVNMFYSLGQRVGGVTDPMSLFVNVFYDFYNILLKQFALVSTGSIWNFFSIVPSVILYFAGIIVLIIAFLLVAGTIFIIEAYIVVALVSGYIFVPFMIFKPLEFLWNGWLKFLLTSAISYFLVFVVLKMFSLFMNNTLLNYIHALNAKASYNLYSIINELIYTFILLMFGYLVTKIPSIAGEIVSGMPNMSITAVIAPVINSFNKISGGGGRTASKTVGEIKRAAGKGGK
ncbi:MAG: type IV secretion system protein [Deltaproteobacteria bacterium]|jgi:hypothetical protein|nr:type IV secretion system protein [Deltaproteobacteria bacterium]MCL5879591.1 type IV secretion system protein [Deltaproteobacteria bacterium]